MSALTILKDKQVISNSWCNCLNSNQTACGASGVIGVSQRIHHNYDVTLPSGRVCMPVKRVNTQATFSLRNGAIESLSFMCSLRNVNPHGNTYYTLLVQQGEKAFVSKRAFCASEPNWISCSTQQLQATDFLYLASIQANLCTLEEGSCYPDFTSPQASDLIFGYASVFDVVSTSATAVAAPVSATLPMDNWEVHILHAHNNHNLINNGNNNHRDCLAKIDELEEYLQKAHNTLSAESLARSRAETRLRNMKNSHTTQHQQLLDEVKRRMFVQEELRMSQEALECARNECEEMRHTALVLQQRIDKITAEGSGSNNKATANADGASSYDALEGEVKRLRAELAQEIAKRQDVEAFAIHQTQLRSHFEEHGAKQHHQVLASVKNVLKKKHDELNEERARRESLEAVVASEASSGWQLVRESEQNNEKLDNSINLSVAGETVQSVREELEREKHLKSVADASFAAAESNLERARSDLAALQERFDVQAFAFKELEAACEDYRIVKSSMEEEGATLRVRVAQLEEELLAAQERVASEISAHEKADADKEGMKNEVNALEGVMNVLREDLSRETRAREQHETELKERTEECARVRSENEALNAQLCEAQQKMSKIVEDHAAAIAQLRAECDQVVASANEEVLAKLEESRARIQSLETACAKLAEDLTSERAVRTKVEAARDAALVDAETKNKFCARVQLNMQQLIRASDDLRGDVENLRNALTESRARESEARKRVVEAEKLVNVMSIVRGELEIERNARAKAELELNRLKRLSANAISAATIAAAAVAPIVEEEEEWEVVQSSE